MDGTYAYVSESSTAIGMSVLSDPIFKDDTSHEKNRMTIMCDGEWLKRIDANRFYIQTNYNTFVFFEMSASPTP